MYIYIGFRGFGFARFRVGLLWFRPRTLRVRGSSVAGFSTGPRARSRCTCPDGGEGRKDLELYIIYVTIKIAVHRGNDQGSLATREFAFVSVRYAHKPKAAVTPGFAPGLHPLLLWIHSWRNPMYNRGDLDLSSDCYACVFGSTRSQNHRLGQPAFELEGAEVVAKVSAPFNPKPQNPRPYFPSTSLSRPRRLRCGSAVRCSLCFSLGLNSAGSNQGFSQRDSLLSYLTQLISLQGLGLSGV